MKNNSPFSRMLDLSGRVALVTGASRGIGKAIATALAEAGAQTIVHGSRMSPQLEEAVKSITENSGNAKAVAADLGKRDEVDKLVAEIKNVDILILNASVQSYQTVEDFTDEEFSRQYEINLRASFELIKAFLPGMKKRRWGRLLTIGSINQYKPSDRLAIYSTTKAALANLTLNCARQYAEFGITANNIAPGVILTDRNEEVLADTGFQNKILDMIPAGRFGLPEDCAGLALLLCSDAGSYITGTHIPVAGGMQL
ncbi:MAG: SDR family NAD(P)-dependent oxidoreductase [Victivallaceae bacterium]